MCFLEPSTGSVVLKLGRTTGLTGGVCNGLETWIKPAHQHTLWDGNDQLQRIRRIRKKLQIDRKIELLKREEDGKFKKEDKNDFIS